MAVGSAWLIVDPLDNLDRFSGHGEWVKIRSVGSSNQLSGADSGWWHRVRDKWVSYFCAYAPSRLRTVRYRREAGV